jgi:hypothetical protein
MRTKNETEQIRFAIQQLRKKGVRGKLVKVFAEWWTGERPGIHNTENPKQIYHDFWRAGGIDDDGDKRQKSAANHRLLNQLLWEKATAAFGDVLSADGKPDPFAERESQEQEIAAAEKRYAKMEEDRKPYSFAK